MANTLYDFATSEASSSQTGGVNTAENQFPSTVNNALRAWKQLQAAWLDDLGAEVANSIAAASCAIRWLPLWHSFRITAVAVSEMLYWSNKARYCSEIAYA